MVMVSLSWKTERRKVSALIPYDKNPRRLTEAQAAQLPGGSAHGSALATRFDAEHKE